MIETSNPEATRKEPSSDTACSQSITNLYVRFRSIPTGHLVFPNGSSPYLAVIRLPVLQRPLTVYCGHQEKMEQHFGTNRFQWVRGAYLKTRVSDDDILDAFAVCWTARRIFLGEATMLPPESFDTYGLPMCIAY